MPRRPEPESHLENLARAAPGRLRFGADAGQPDLPPWVSARAGEPARGAPGLSLGVGVTGRKPLFATFLPPLSVSKLVPGARRRGRGGIWRRGPREVRPGARRGVGGIKRADSRDTSVPACAHVAVCREGSKSRWGMRNGNLEQLPFVQVCVLEGARAREAGHTFWSPSQRSATFASEG